ADKNITARRPAIMRANPDPRRIRPQPIPSAEHILAVSPIPAWRYPNHFNRRRRAGWVDDLQGRRRWQIFDFLIDDRRPEPRHPSPLPTTCFCPVTRYPGHLRRCLSPAGADPDVIAMILIPGPIAGNPDVVIARGTLRRRSFLDGRRRRLGCHRLGILI